MPQNFQEIFKAYDIRAVYPSQINEKNVYKIARGYATYLIDMNPLRRELKVVVSQDMRLSSPSLAKEVIKGLVDSGIDVVDVGLASTPTFYFAVAEGGYDGGMQVSASHNPAEYNGIKIVREKAFPVSLEDGLAIIRDLAISGDFKSLKKKAKITKDKDVLERTISHSISFDDFSNLKKLKIVADPANSMGAPDLDALFRELPCELKKMNFKLDGSFPSHQPDPFQEKNIATLKKEVVSSGADLGIATDGDGDRIFFVDENGSLIGPSILRGLLAKIILRNNKGAKIGYDIRPGKITRDMIIDNGGEPFVTRVGHSIIKRISIENDAVFSGESSGHFFIKTDHGFFETPLLVALYIMKEISQTGKKISEIIEPYKKYSHSGEINFIVVDKEVVSASFHKKFSDGAQNVNELDGLTIEHEEFWMNLRPSNTEPLLRLNLEAVNQEMMELKRDEIISFVEDLGGSMADH